LTGLRRMYRLYKYGVNCRPKRRGTAPQIVERDDRRATVAHEMQQGRVNRGDEYLHEIPDLVAPDFALERWIRGDFVAECHDAIVNGRLVMKPPPPLTTIIHVMLKYIGDIDQRVSVDCFASVRASAQLRSHFS
jgi:hypothetical protein